MKKNRISKKNILVLLCIILMLSIVGCGNIEEQKEEIDSKIEKIEGLKGEVYFTENHEKQLQDLKDSYANAVENKDSKALDDISSQADKTYEEIENEIKKYNELYEKLGEEVKKTEEYKKDYFVEDYDTSKIDETTKNVNEALENSDCESYESLYSDISRQNESLKQFIDEKKDNLYNVQTSQDPNEKYPFKVDESEIPVDSYDFSPVNLQSSKHPHWIHSNEPETTDEPYTVCMYRDGSYRYTISTKQKKTKKIKVQSDDKSIKTALVNTQVKFAIVPELRDNKLIMAIDYVKQDERPGYFCKDKHDQIILLLKSYDGEDYYVPYSRSGKPILDDE